ncbi:hypothetical protein RN001_011187 [Aquatica leii]|uniref:BTB domain-containing protein n=1 Tax=Aquatica leii TaxID=1421715 RepID=A0AAN7PAS6_9COLE|nr:hypothetical protein RN001_011187 [Aquatica leii]
MNDNVEIIRSNKGGLKLIHRGYMYTVHKKRQGGGIRWRCTQRSWHCKGSISTGNGPPTVNMPHNHIPDPHSVALARCRQIQEFPDLTSMLETEYDEARDTPSTQQRMPFNAPQLQIPPECPLQTQPLSPTKLKVTRNNKPIPNKNSSDLPPEEVCLRWNSHHSNMQNCFPRLLEKGQYVDVTLIAEGKSLKCHRMILSSCSAYFEEILADITPMQHPVIILKSTPFWILRALIDFMYAGEVNIDQNKLPELLDTAESLKIKGLAGKSTEPEPSIKQEAPVVPKTEDMPINDPLELLQPKSQDDCGLLKNKDKVLPRKILGKKIRKRKSSEDECSSPPLFPMRRGTRSRPNVKVPRYYDYEDIVKPTTSDQAPSPGVTIKSEPPDVDSDGSCPPDYTSSKGSISEVPRIKVDKTKAEITRVTKDKPVKEEMKPEQLYKIKIKCLASMSEKPVEELPPQNAEKIKTEDASTSDLTETDPKKDDILNALEIIKIDVNVNKEKPTEPKDDAPQVEIIASEKPLTENKTNVETKLNFNG